MIWTQKITPCRRLQRRNQKFLFFHQLYDMSETCLRLSQLRWDWPVPKIQTPHNLLSWRLKFPQTLSPKKLNAVPCLTSYWRFAPGNLFKDIKNNATPYSVNMTSTLLAYFRVGKSVFNGWWPVRIYLTRDTSRKIYNFTFWNSFCLWKGMSSQQSPEWIMERCNTNMQWIYY